MVPQTWCATDRWTDRQTEKKKYMGAPAKKLMLLGGAIFKHIDQI